MSEEINKSASVVNGRFPASHFRDELDDLRQRYTLAQVKTMWEELKPKNTKINNLPIIIGTGK